MKKQLVVTLSVLMTAVLVLVGCSSGNNADEKTVITFMNFSSSGANEENLEEMIKEFEKQNPDIKVDVQTYGYSDYSQQLSTKVAGNSAPDVFELNIENFRTYAEKGVIVPLDEKLQQEGVDISEIHPKALEAFKINGQQYGLPTKFSNVVMIYNKDLFDQAGIAYPTNDWTWGDELAAAEKIKALGENYYGIYRSIQTHEFYKTVAQNGGSMMNDDQTEFTLNRSENVEALQMMIDRVNVANVTPNEDQMGGMGDWDLFKSGRLGMIVTGIWAFPDFKENVDFDWDIVIEPGIKQKATHFFSDAVVVSKDSKHQEAATKLCAFLTASEEVANIRLDANWDLPVVLTDEVKERYLSSTPPNNKEVVFESLEYLVMPPSLEKFGEISDDLNKHLEQALAGKMSAQEALDAAQVEISKKY